MTPFDYALGLISILMSLALADIVMSFHKLLRVGRTVKWDGRILVASTLVIVEIIRMWFALWTVRDVEILLTFPIYAGLFLHTMLLVLTAAACLPDETVEGYDLTAFYERNRRYFWSAFALSQTAYFLLWLVFGGNQAAVGTEAEPFDWLRVLAPLAAYGLLAFLRVRILDYALPLGIIGFYGWLYWPQTLGA